jgi:hypothetical protein
MSRYATSEPEKPQDAQDDDEQYEDSEEAA